ncbi:hypothetical protein ACQEU8_28965 [Streptomyces sp. CA-250714]|uniref:hypothetical protein n=1 Tax=Streptomyces sp. CA-250714 TaxID=3240060 RepID=UPI003D91934A
MILKRTFQTAGVAVAALATSLAMATSAHAADHKVNTTDDRPGGKLTFTRNGDVVEVCDEQEDGWRAVGYVINPDGSYRYVMAAGGSGTCLTKGAADGSPWNLNENKTYTFRICLDHDKPEPSDDRFCNSRKWRAGAG